MLLRLRCYLPSTSATLLILVIAYIALHGVAAHRLAGLGLATEIVIGLGLAGLAAGTILISAVTIRHRRAAAGACHACSHPCRGALVPSPEIDTRQWPHRPLSISRVGLSRQPQGLSWPSAQTKPTVGVSTPLSHIGAGDSHRTEDVGRVGVRARGFGATDRVISVAPTSARPDLRVPRPQ